MPQTIFMKKEKYGRLTDDSIQFEATRKEP